MIINDFSEMQLCFAIALFVCCDIITMFTANLIISEVIYLLYYLL